MVEHANIEEILKQQGLSEFKWIDPHEIIVAHWVRIKCMFGCNEYGGSVCPPNTPPVSECASFFNEYTSGLLIKLEHYGDKNHYPSEWSASMTKSLLELERRVFLLGFQKTFLLNQTCCGICKDCSHTRIDCKDKTDARPSPEGFAVDVYQTVRNAGWDINVVAENPAQFNRIAILLID